MRQFRGQIMIIDSKRINNTMYGAPQYNILGVLDNETKPRTFKLGNNTSTSYAYDNYYNNKYFNLVYHITKNLNLIIDSIDFSKEVI